FSRTTRHLTFTLFPYTTLFRSYRYSRWADLLPRLGRTAIAEDAKDPSRRRAAVRRLCRPHDRCDRRPDRRGPGSADLRRRPGGLDRKSTRLNSSHRTISYAVFC